jgi:hypothetical protein
LNHHLTARAAHGVALLLTAIVAFRAGTVATASAAELDCGFVQDTLGVGELDAYELTAAPGSTVMIAVGEPTGLAGFDPSFTLTDGNGAVLASCSAASACNATATLTGPAPHTVSVFDVGSDFANTYNLTVVPLSDAFGGETGCSTPLGCDVAAPVSDTLARGELHSYVLDAEAGSVVMVAVAEPLDFFNFDPTFTLTDGTGAVLATCTNASGCNATAVLSGSPPFLVTVFDVGSDVANGYNLSVVPLSEGLEGTGCTTALGCDAPTPVTGSLVKGEIDSYQIVAAEGGTLMIAVGETELRGGFNPSFTLTDGDGVELAACSAANGCNSTVVLSGPSPYTVTVFDVGSDSAHDYNLSVVPLSDAFPGETGCMQSLGCASQIPIGAALARGEVDSYRLTAEPGSVIMLAIAEPAPFDGFDPTFALTDADGAEIASCSAVTGCNQRATLTGPAPYTVTVFDVGSDIESSYNLSVAPLSDAFPSEDGCAVNVGCDTTLPITGSLAKGDLASYRLSASAGHTLDVQIAETPATYGFNPTFVVTAADGTELATCSGTNGCSEQATLNGPAPFTITVFDVGSDSANGYQLSPALSPCGVSTTTAPSTSTTLDNQSGCSLPVTSGPTPKASDCLFILGAAVGSRTCAPQCVCDTNADAAVSASDALRCLRAAVGQPVALNCPCSS